MASANIENTSTPLSALRTDSSQSVLIASNQNATPNSEIRSKKRKTYIKRSWVWKFFSDPTEKKVKCGLCQIELSYTTSTTNLRNHLNKFHNMNEPNDLLTVNFEYGFDEDNFDSQSSDDDDENNSLNVKKKERINRCLIDFIACSNQPLSLVEHPEFKAFVKELNNGYKLPSRNTFTTRLLPDRVNNCFY